MNYMLKNINAEKATAVLVKNALDNKPTAPCGTGVPDSDSGVGKPKGGARTGASGKSGVESPPAASPVFVYSPWQFLNPSFGATEEFDYRDILSVVVQKTSTDGTICSKRTPVQVGNGYMLVIGEVDIQVVFDRQNGKDYVEIATPTPSVDPLSVTIDWYLSGLNFSNGLSVGRTQNIGPNTSAYFQPDNGVLLFLPVDANKQNVTYSSADVASATAYQPPSGAIQVQVTLQTDEAGKLRYVFDPPNALPQE